MPVMPDTRILSGGISEPQPMPSPMQTLGSMMKIKEEQQAYRARQLEAEGKQREYEDDMAVRFSLQQHERPEDAMDALLKQGRSGAYSKLGKDVYTARAAEFNAKSEQLKQNAGQLKIAGQMLASVKDDASYQPVRRTVVDMAKGMLGEGAEDLFPTTYDPDKLGLIVKMATDRETQIQQEHNQAQLLQQANQLRINAYAQGALTGSGLRQASKGEFGQGVPELSDDGQRAQDMEREYVARDLLTAETQGDWNQKLSDAWQKGVSLDVLRPFQNIKWDARNVEHTRQQAEMLGLPLEKQAEVTARRENAKTEDLRRQDAVIKAQQEEYDRQQRLRRDERRDAARDRRDAAVASGEITAAEARTYKEEDDLKAELAKIDEKAKEEYESRPDAFNVFTPDAPKSQTGTYSYNKKALNPDQTIAKAYDFGYDKLRDLPDKDLQKQSYVEQVLAVNDRRRARVLHLPKLEDAAREAKKNGDVAAYEKLVKEVEVVTHGVGDLEQIVKWKGRNATAAGPAAPAAPLTPAQRDEASNRARGIYQRLGSDKTLTPTQRAEMNQQALDLMRRAKGL